MSDRAIGLGFLAIGAFLFAMKHLAEATYKAGDLATNAVSYKNLGEVGELLTGLAGFSAVVGAFFFVKGNRASREADGDQ